MGLFCLGDFVLNSGKCSPFKIECDALTIPDWVALAEMVSLTVPPFSSVEGIPRGGLQLARALLPHVTPDANRHLIVDDVLTTGGSMNRRREEVWVEMGRPSATIIMGAVVFARGPSPAWITPLFQLPKPLFLPDV